MFCSAKCVTAPHTKTCRWFYFDFFFLIFFADCLRVLARVWLIDLEVTAAKLIEFLVQNSHSKAISFLLKGWFGWLWEHYKHHRIFSNLIEIEIMCLIFDPSLSRTGSRYMLFLLSRKRPLEPRHQFETRDFSKTVIKVKSKSSFNDNDTVRIVIKIKKDL